jgi:catechol 2,3-dioxygenase-like lactoylglutathione lyase family enzyme
MLTSNRLLSLSLCLGTAIVFSTATLSTSSAEEESEFGSQTIDIGVVVSDLEKSLKFYTEVVGLKEAGGFEVNGQVASDAGLTEAAGLNIKVLTLGAEKSATKLKLVEVIGVQSEKDSNEFIHKQTGFSYITVHVSDMNAAIKRLEKADVKPVANGPVALPKELAEGVFLTVIRDPDGNFVELVGPAGAE